MNKTMKIAIIIGIILLLLTGTVVGGYFYFSRDGEELDMPSLSPTTPTVEPSLDLSVEVPPTTELGEPGVIEREVLFNGVVMSKLFTEPFKDILGEPMSVDGIFAQYDGLEIVLRADEAGNLDRAWQLWVLPPNFGMFKFNGVSFDNVTRIDLITTLGAPLEHYEHINGLVFEASAHDSFIMYYVPGEFVDYILTFSFENFSDPEELTGISIMRADWEWCPS